MTDFFTSMQSTAMTLITQFGMPAVLRRVGSTDRPCTICIYDYAPRDPVTQLANPTQRKVLISVTGLLTNPPDNEQDQLVPSQGPDANVPLPFAQPVKPYAPNGTIICWDCVVRR